MAGLSLGLGTLGNVASALPLTIAVQYLGWRGAILSVAFITFAIAILIFLFVKNPPRLDSEKVGSGSIFSILRIPAIWPIIAIMSVTYAPAAGIRGLWIGPYLADVFVASNEMIGTATLIMGFAMILGSILYGPLDRVVPSKKKIILVGNLMCSLSCFSLFVFPGNSLVTSIILLAMVGFFGSSFAIIIGHGRDFIPPHLIGRGVTLLNLFGIGGAGLIQAWSGKIFLKYSLETSLIYSYQALFLFFGL
mgnify:FL=1